MGDFCLMNTVNSLIDRQHLKYVKLLIKNIKIVFYTVGLLLMNSGRLEQREVSEKLLKEAG